MSSLIPPNSRSVNEFDPYAAPQHQHPDTSQGDSDIEVMRRTYLSHEATTAFNADLWPRRRCFGLCGPYPASQNRLYVFVNCSIKSTGVCFLFLGAVIFSGAVGMAFVPRAPGDVVLELLIWVLATSAGLAFMFTGCGMHRLRRWSRIPTGIISGLGLMGVPLWTLINAYILYRVFCA